MSEAQIAPLDDDNEGANGEKWATVRTFEDGCNPRLIADSKTRKYNDASFNFEPEEVVDAPILEDAYGRLEMQREGNHPLSDKVFINAEKRFEKFLNERNDVEDGVIKNMTNTLLNLLAKYKPDSPVVKFMWDLPSIYLFSLSVVWFSFWIS